MNVYILFIAHKRFTIPSEFRILATSCWVKCYWNFHMFSCSVTIFSISDGMCVKIVNLEAKFKTVFYFEEFIASKSNDTLNSLLTVIHSNRFRKILNTLQNRRIFRRFFHLGYIRKWCIRYDSPAGLPRRQRFPIMFQHWRSRVLRFGSE